jgi:hypothetical protein
MRLFIVAVLAAFFMSGCIGDIVSAPFKIVGGVIDIVLP